MACSSLVGDMRNWCLSLFDGKDTRWYFTSREISYFLVAVSCVLAD